MRVAVGVRSAPHRIEADGNSVRTHRPLPNLPDRVAVEAALQHADAAVAVAVGGEAARDALRDALTMGVDEGVHVAFDPVEESVAEKYATVLARAAAREDADALLVGEFGPLAGPEVPGLAAGTLDWPAVTRVTRFGADAVDADVDPGDADLVVQRRLATGEQEVLAVDTPVVVGVDSGFGNPRRGSLEDAIAGRRADVREVALETVAPSESRFSMSVGRATVESVRANTRWGRGDPPRTGTVQERIRQMLGRGGGGESGGGEKIEAPPEEAADRVVEYLREQDLL